MITSKYIVQNLKARIKSQILDHEKEMNKKNNQFDFYEGRKIEAEVILNWVEETFKNNGN